MNILILTRSLWNEPPRLRHQVAELLINNGHHIYFSERPLFLLDMDKRNKNAVEVSNQLTLIRPYELIHHQLRVLPVIHYINSILMIKSLKKQLKVPQTINEKPLDLIINFNYDAFWLKKTFPSIPIYTIINDDFESLSRLPFNKHLSWALRKSCIFSDKVFAVSQPLVVRLSEWAKTELFLPWSSIKYSEPESRKKRNVILFWGYINERLDIDSLIKSLPFLDEFGIRMRFIGPTSDQFGKKAKELLMSFSNVEWFPVCSFNELITDDCFAAIIPYRINSPGVKAIQLSNKALQLLSLGLPIIISSMPNFHKATFIKKYDNEENLLHQVAYALSKIFYSLQPEIAQFVSDNQPESRLKQLIN